MLGPTFKEIRQQKNLTQADVSKNILSQSAFSKFEQLDTNIKVTHFYQLVDRLDMSVEEFYYIENNHTYTMKQYVFQKFTQISFYDIDALQQLLKEIKDYKEHNQLCNLLFDIEQICYASMSFFNNKDIEVIRDLLQPTWDRLSKKNQLYYSDIHLLNAILWILPVETALHIRVFLEKAIDRYGDYQNIKHIKIKLYLNLALSLLKEKKYIDSLKFLDEAIHLCKYYHDYYSLAFAYFRKGVCLNLLNKDGECYIMLAHQLFELMEKQNILDILYSELYIN